MIRPSRRSLRNERGRREFLLSPMERLACAATETRNRLSAFDYSFGALVRAVFPDQRHFRNKPFEFFEPLAQFRFLACYLFLPAAKRRAGLGRTTKHRHHLLAIQMKRARAMAPKIISGKVSATPIWNH